MMDNVAAEVSTGRIFMESILDVLFDLGTRVYTIILLILSCFSSLMFQG